MIDHEEFEKLDESKQMEIIRQSPIRDKGDLLLRSHDPARFTRALSHEELYLVTRDLDLEEKSELFRYATIGQIMFIADLECWKKDRIDPESLLKWIETLALADENKLLAWFLESDYETVIAGLKDVVRVIKPEWEYAVDEALGDDHYFTLDNFYYVCVKEDQLDMVRRAFEILFENHRGKYTAILEGILGELDYEVEEEALHRREARLQDHGFPNPENARQVFRPISHEEFENYPPKRKLPPVLVGDEKPGIYPNYPVLWSSEHLFLDEVLLEVDRQSPELRHELEEELAWLSNKVIATQGVDRNAEEQIREGVNRTRCLLNLGLELASGRDLKWACQLVREKWLEVIFRWGVTHLVEIREAAESTAVKYWRSVPRSLITFLSPPYEVIFRGLLQTVPECFDPDRTGKDEGIRNFTKTEDLERAKSAVKQIGKIHDFMDKNVPRIFDELNRHIKDENPPVLYLVLASLFAAYALKGKMVYRVFSEAEVRQFIGKVFLDDRQPRVLDPEVKTKFLSEYFNAEDAGMLRSLWAFVFQALDEEFGRLDLSEAVDPEFIALLKMNGCRPAAKTPVKQKISKRKKT